MKNEALLQNMKDEVAAEQAAKLEKINNLEGAIKDDLEAAYQEGMNKVTTPETGAVWTDAQLDAEIKAKVEPLNAEISDLKAAIVSKDEKIASLEAEVAKRDELVSEQVEAFKAQLLAKYDEAQVAETAAETGFKDLLAPKAAPAPVEPAN